MPTSRHNLTHLRASMRRVMILFALGALAAGGCGTNMAKVKGRLISHDQPMTFPATQVAVSFSPIGPDGKPDPAKSYTCVVNEDGSFELVASGGELPAGSYQVSIQAMGKLGAQLKRFVGTGSPI